MQAVSGKELAALVERHGGRLLRIHGSHHMDGKGGSRATVFVPWGCGRMENGKAHGTERMSWLPPFL